MSFMGRIAKLDSAMQRGLDNSFALVFGGRVVPAEIEEVLKQESEDNLVHTYEGTVEAPNVFTVRVSTKDGANLSATAPNLPADFADRLTRFHRNNRWITPGLVTVFIEVDSSLHTGQLRASSKVDANASGMSAFIGTPDNPDAIPAEGGAGFPERQIEMAQSSQWPGTEHLPAQPAVPQAPTPAPEPPVVAYEPPRPIVSLLLQDGSSRTYVLHEGSNIIGRSNDVDFRLPDTGVSRHHAEITWDGQQAIVVDLQSTNGTSINGMRIDNWLLADGDVITVGHSNIEVRITTPA